MSRRSHVWVPALLGLATTMLYAPHLQDAPTYPQRDEMYFALTAHSVAFTAHDPSGLYLPVYFPIGPPGRPLMWFQPMLMYLIALVVRTLPLSETTIRLPMIAAAVADVVLIYLVARLLVQRELLAIVAAALLALAPAHFIFSRLALDYQLPLPFILGWLLCVLRYLKNGRPRLLLAAGLILGFGLYTLIAANVLMPFYVLVTCAALYKRREPPTRYLLPIVGFLLPALIGALFLLRHPAIVRDVVLRYESLQPPAVGIFATVRTFVQSRHLGNVASMYWTFWNPRLLFIDGRGMLTGTAGVFLLPVAGAFVVGVVRALRRLDTVSVLLLCGLLSAPLPASVANEPEAIRRALELLPFVVLLAVYGLDYLWAANSSRIRALSFFCIPAVVVVLIERYREYVPYAQAFIRAASVPVAIIGLAVLLRQTRIDHRNGWKISLTALCSLAAFQVAYFIAGSNLAVPVTLVLMAAIGFAALNGIEAADDRARVHQLPAIALLALVATAFVYFYVDYPVRRIGVIPASIQLLAIRSLCAGTILIAAIAMSSMLDRAVLGWSEAQLAVAGSIALVVIQLAYFRIDHFGSFPPRSLHVAAVALAVIAVAMLFRGFAVSRLPLGELATSALIGIAVVQFTWFYADYFAGYRTRRSSDSEGSIRAAYETLLDYGDHVRIPAVYLAHQMEFAWVRDLYWRFYVLKHDRQDLLTRTINAESSAGLEHDRIHTLPAGSMVIATASREAEIEIDRLVSAGELKRETLVRAADGVPAFWILSTSGGGAR